MKNSKPFIQHDFWPELKNRSMVFYAGATSTSVPTPVRSPMGEDSRRNNEAGTLFGQSTNNTNISAPSIAREFKHVYDYLFADGALEINRPSEDRK